MPWQAQRRQVKQHREERPAELWGGLRCGKEATLRVSRRPCQRRPTAASRLQMERTLAMTFCTAPRASHGSRRQRSRVWEPEQNLNTGDRESYSGTCAGLFPPGSSLITLLISKTRAETHTSVTSAMTRYQQWQLPLRLQQRHSALTTNSADKARRRLQ